MFVQAHPVSSASPPNGLGKRYIASVSYYCSIHIMIHVLSVGVSAQPEHRPDSLGADKTSEISIELFCNTTYNLLAPCGIAPPRGRLNDDAMNCTSNVSATVPDYECFRTSLTTFCNTSSHPPSSTAYPLRLIAPVRPLPRPQR